MSDILGGRASRIPLMILAAFSVSLSKHWICELLYVSILVFSLLPPGGCGFVVSRIIILPGGYFVRTHARTSVYIIDLISVLW